MNPDLFLAILAMDSYNRGYDQRIDLLGDTTRIGLAKIQVDAIDQLGEIRVRDAGFYALSYELNGETIVSYRGTDALNDVIYGWTVGAGWTDQAQSDLALEFYEAATGRDPFATEIPTDITLTGHSLGGGLAGLNSINDNEITRQEQAA